MRFLSNIFGRNKTKDFTNTLPGRNYRPYVYMDGELIKSSSYINADTALKNSDIFSVVNLISADISSCQFLTENDYVKHMLNAPNPILNSFNFWQSVTGQMLLDGNAYVLMHFDHDELSWFEHIRPNQVQLYIDDGGQHLEYQVTFDDDRETIRVPSSQMLHFKLLSNASKSQYLGVSPLQSLIMDLNIQDAANSMAYNSISKAIRPNGIISLNNVLTDDESREHYRSEFEKANSGSNQGRPLILDGGAGFSSPQVDSGIAKLLDSVTYTRVQVAKAFGVPQDFLNSESAHSNIDQIRSTYSQSLNKYIYAITSELTMKLGVGVDMNMASAIDPDHNEYITKIDMLVKDGVLDGNQGVFLLQSIGYLPDDLPEKAPESTYSTPNSDDSDENES